MVSFSFTTNSNLASWQKPNCQTLQNYLPFSQMRYILEAISISGCHFELSWKIGENVVLKRVIIIQQMHKTLFTVDMITYIESFRRYPNLEYKRIFQRYIKEGNLPFCWNIWTLSVVSKFISILLQHNWIEIISKWFAFHACLNSSWIIMTPFKLTSYILCWSRLIWPENTFNIDTKIFKETFRAILIIQIYSS